MTQATELLELLATLVPCLDRTARDLEQADPGAAEVGYWDRREKYAFDRAKEILASKGVSV